jgi:hypothetical protein
MRIVGRQMARYGRRGVMAVQVRKIAYLSVVVLGVGASVAHAQGPREDSHTRPLRYDDPTLSVPPASGGAPQYPLAAAFISADASNYTAGGINSFDYVVVHTMQGYYAGSISWFQNPAANVSAHYCMRAEDGEVTQMVHDEDRAWHVGNSNSTAIGIEHEGFVDDASWYTYETYLSSARLARWLCEIHDIPVDRDHIVGHVELPAQTHTDPGPNWDWDFYMALVRDMEPPATISGVVVDASSACVIDIESDTWLTTTLQDPDDVDAGNKCAIDAGTPLVVQWVSDPMLGRVRVTLEDAPCPGSLATEAFIDAGQIPADCHADPIADATVTIGDAVVTTDASGRFEVTALPEGEHLVDVDATDYDLMSVAVALAAHPGAHVVVAVEPIGGPGEPDPGGSDGAATDAEGDGDGSTGDSPGGAISDDTAADGDATSFGGEALPDTFGGAMESGGCACRADGRSGAPFGGLMGGLWFAWTRRSSRRSRSGRTAGT